MSLVSPFIYISSLGLTGTKLVSHFQVNIPWAERSAIKAVGEKLSVTLSRLVQGLKESFLSMNVISFFFLSQAAIFELCEYGQSEGVVYLVQL